MPSFNNQPLLVLVGARPNFIKLAPLVRALGSAGESVRIIHTGQHYDDPMSAAFFRVLGIPAPDVNLGVKAASRAGQVGEIVTKLDAIFAESRPRLMCVIGDVTSTLAGAVPAASADIPVAHI